MNATKIILLAEVTLILAWTQAAQAASGTFTGSSDAMWMNAANWSSGTVPGVADTATFNSAANGNTTINLSGIASAVTAVYFDTVDAAAFTLGSGGANGQTLTLGNAGTASTISMTSTVANNQTIDCALTLGNSGTTASYTLANAASAQILTFNGDITGGSGGTAGTKTLTLNATGTITLNGSLSKGGATALNLTKAGAGTLNLNGTTTVGGLIMGQNAAGGTVTVGSGVTVSVGAGAGSALYVGHCVSGAVGTGTFDLTNAQGLIANVGTLGVGYCSAPGSGGSVATTGTLTLGGAGTITADNCYVGVGLSSGAGGDFATVGKFVLATGATLTLSGTSGAGANLYVGWSFGGSNASAETGNMDLSLGAANLTLNQLWVGRAANSPSGTGTLTLSGSYVNHLVVSGAGSVVTIGNSGGGTGSGKVTLCNLDATSAITSSNNSTAILLGANHANATGTLILSGGTLTITTTGSAITKGAGKGYLTLDSVTLVAGDGNATSGKWITGLTTATLTGAVTFDSGTFSLSSDQAFRGSGSLTKAGPGTMTLSGSNTYSGGTTVSNGTLLVNGSIVSNVVVASTGGFGGTGTVSGSVTLEPGASGIFMPGSTLNITGSLVLQGNNTAHLIVPDGTTNGTYRVGTYNETGSSGTFGGVVIDTTNLVKGSFAEIVVNGGTIDVKIKPPPLGTLIVIE